MKQPEADSVVGNKVTLNHICPMDNVFKLENFRVNGFVEQTILVFQKMASMSAQESIKMHGNNRVNRLFPASAPSRAVPPA